MESGANGVLLHLVLVHVDGVFNKEHENVTIHLHVVKEENVSEIQWNENCVANKDVVQLVSLFFTIVDVTKSNSFLTLDWT